MEERIVLAKAYVTTAITMTIVIAMMVGCQYRNNEMAHAKNLAMLENGCDTQEVVRLKARLNEIKDITQRLK